MKPWLWATFSSSKNATPLIERLKESGAAVILVTHGMDAALKYCANAILLKHGKSVSFLVTIIRSIAIWAKIY